MQEVPVTQARAELSDLVNRVVYAGERIVLTRHGRAVAAIVSAEDLQRLISEHRNDEPAGSRLTVLDSGVGGRDVALPPAAGPGRVEQPGDLPGPGLP